ncbi:hypothetical protein FGL83_06355 [Leuconostoc lactis]|uniref:Uncharacterized protein n=1 Tax=Leuconostoc lactis TaxID=1246 RepID=A0AAP9ECI9_LEULA|nr:hypothetical protein [Leuconostoc lactis]QEA44312.1 hypothetical protein FGL83_06355 [Leuconostoc lactis]
MARKHFKTRYLLMAVLTIGMLLCISVPAIHRTTTTKKAAQALSQRVASENAAVTGLYGKEKRPDNVPVTSGESVASSAPATQAGQDTTASPVYLMQVDGVWLFRNVETGQDHQLTPDEIQRYVSQSTQDVVQKVSSQ